MASKFADGTLNRYTAYAKSSPVFNLGYGGQNGHMYRLGLIGPDGKPYDEWIFNQAYVKRNVIPIVLQYPKFFDFMPYPDLWIQAYKALMEVHPKSIDGLNSTLSVETDSHPVGGSGEIQEEVTNVTRAPSTPTFVWQEKANRSIQRFLETYIKVAMMDPVTKTANIHAYLNSIDDVGGIYTPDFYTGTMLFIEPDVTNKVVTNAWLCCNMFPKSSGDNTGKRDVHSANELVEHSIEFSSLGTPEEPVLVLAQSVLDNLGILNKTPDINLVLPVDDVDSKLKATKTGFNDQQTA